MTVSQQKDEPQQYAAPDAGMAEPRPGVHLYAGLEAGGDDDQRVHGVAKHQVAVRPGVKM